MIYQPLISGWNNPNDQRELAALILMFQTWCGSNWITSSNDRYSGDWKKHSYEITAMWLVAVGYGYARITYLREDGDLVFTPSNESHKAKYLLLVYDPKRIDKFLSQSSWRVRQAESEVRE